MNWNRDKSVMLSRWCVAVFAVCLAALDIGAYRFARWFVAVRQIQWQFGVLLMISIYAGSVFGWLCLCQLRRLLNNIRHGDVFVADNVRCMRLVSWCCAGASLVSLLSSAYYLPFAFVAVASGFMGLIVRIVKNAFQQAIAMKDELDFTV